MEERSLNPGDKVDIYWNLHKKVFSVRHRGLVVAHVRSAALRNVSFVVSESGRQRVLRERRKNVHAFVRGEWVSDRVGDREFCEDARVSYNPYRGPKFFGMDGRVKESAEAVILSSVGKPSIFEVKKSEVRA